jgi:1,4-dihydroxy-2-naphthoate octaprenyltransferase
MKRFFDYTEIKTKVTSLFPFLTSLAYLYYLRGAIRWDRTALFFVPMFLFDLTTTAINNYIDSRTNGQTLPYKRGTARAVIFILLGASVAFALMLVAITDAVVMLTGGLCFLCGVFYTYGPLPISRQPLGELLSGVFYGFFIPFLMLYINLPSGSLLTLVLSFQSVSLSFRVLPMIHLLLLCAVPTFTTANIMLANNICDVDKDVAVRRFTLPYYLGKSALRLFALLYYGSLASMAMMVVIGMLPPLCLLGLLTAVPVQRNISRFMQKQEKATTFIASIQNYVLLNGALLLVTLAAALLK